MTFPSYRKDSIEELLASCPPAVRRLLQASRRRLLALVPEASERLRAGWGILGYDAPRYFAYLAAMPDHVRIGFERGILLEDPDGLLEGTGTQVRHVCIRKAGDLRSPGLARLVRQAAALGAPRPRSAGRRRRPA